MSRRRTRPDVVRDVGRKPWERSRRQRIDTPEIRATNSSFRKFGRMDHLDVASIYDEVLRRAASLDEPHSEPQNETLRINCSFRNLRASRPSGHGRNRHRFRRVFLRQQHLEPLHGSHRRRIRLHARTRGEAPRNGGLFFWGTQSAGARYSGSPAVDVWTVGTPPLYAIMRRLDGKPFNVTSLDSSYSVSLSGGSRTVEVTGIKADSSVVTQSFVVDSATSFETYAINSEFTGLTQFRWRAIDLGLTASQNGFSVDNIRVTAIPEPSMVGFLIAGSVVAMSIRPRKRQRQSSRN